jgi:hypothetical protein
MREKSVHLWRTHGSRMALMVEEDKALDPVHIRTFRAHAVVFEANGLANAIEGFGLVIH